MSEVKSWKCDICGILKQETNHWITAIESREEAAVTFRPWSESEAKCLNVLHLCGEGCATKVLSRQITAWR